MQDIIFTLDGEYVELNQLLKLAGLCDSGGAGKIIRRRQRGVAQDVQDPRGAGRHCRQCAHPRAGMNR